MFTEKSSLMKGQQVDVSQAFQDLVMNSRDTLPVSVGFHTITLIES